MGLMRNSEEELDLKVPDGVHALWDRRSGSQGLRCWGLPGGWFEGIQGVNVKVPKGVLTPGGGGEKFWQGALMREGS